MKSRPWHTPQYKAHLRSDKWKARRRSYFKDHGYRCEACGTRKRITVHHVHYESLGNEADEALRALCWPDHRNVHEAFNNGRFVDLRAATDFIVARGQARLARRKFARSVVRRLTAPLVRHLRHAR